MREGCGSRIHVDVHFVTVRVLRGCGGEFKKCRLRLFVSKCYIWMNWCAFVSKGFVGESTLDSLWFVWGMKTP